MPNCQLVIGQLKDAISSLLLHTKALRYIYNGLEGLGPDMEEYHSKLQTMKATEYLKRHDSSGEIISSSWNGITSRVISEDFCITKLFNADIYGETKPNFPSWASVQLFRHALKSLWIPKYFPPKSKSAALEMWTTIKEDLEKVFKENTWMDKKSKQMAIDKLKAIQFHGGYHDEILQKDKMQSFHNKFLVETLEENSYVENQVNLSLNIICTCTKLKTKSSKSLGDAICM